MTKDAEQSGALATKAVWKCGAAGFGAPRKGDYRLPGAAEETDDVCGQTASGAWAGTAQDNAGSKDIVDGRRPCTDGSPRRSVWLVYPDTLCANGRDGRTPAARNTSDGIHPGRGVEE